MPLLLLLSALLTALTGVVTGARPVDVQITRPMAADVRQVAGIAVRVAAGHAHLLGGFAPVAGFAVRRPLAAITAVPRLYLDRPRA